MVKIFRQPGKTGMKNLKAVKSADCFSGNGCHGNSSSNERKRKMKLNSIIFCLCAGMCSSALIDNAFSMEDKNIPSRNFSNEKGRLGVYQMMIASKYFESIDDYKNLEFAMPKGYKNTDKFHFNPVSITPDQLHLWSSLNTLHLYTDNDIQTWMNYNGDMEKICKIEVWTDISDRTAVNLSNDISNKWKNMKATFRNVRLANPDIFGKFDSGGNYKFNDDVYTAGTQGDAKFVIKKIDDNAFRSNSKLTSIAIPNSVESIGSAVFHECENLTSVTIPDSVKSVGDATFFGCRKLESIKLSENVMWIGGGAFSLTNARIEVPYNAMKKHIIATNFINEDRVEVVGPVNKTMAWIWSDDGDIIIPDGVDSINKQMFVGREDIKSIVIPDSVRTFWHGAFWSCDAYKYVVPSNAIKEILINTGVDKHRIAIKGREDQWWISVDGKIVIPNSVEMIEKDMFKDRKDITSVEIPNSITEIGENAFWGCAELNSITIPGSVKSIGSGAFYMCWACTFTAPNKEIKDMLINSLVDEYRIAVQGEENQWWIPVDGRLVVPDGVECIEDHMFQARDDIMSVEIPNSVISIGKYAFGESCKLTSITISDSVESIGGYAFYGCKRMSSITISDRLESIGLYAFCGCHALDNIFVKCSTGQISTEKAAKIKEMIGRGYGDPDKVHFINANGEEILPTDE